MKKLNETRWEARISNDKAGCYQIGAIQDASPTWAIKSEKPDVQVSHEAIIAAEQLKYFSFVISLVVGIEMLLQINDISKSLQSLLIRI